MKSTKVPYGVSIYADEKEIDLSIIRIFQDWIKYHNFTKEELIAFFNLVSEEELIKIMNYINGNYEL